MMRILILIIFIICYGWDLVAQQVTTFAGSGVAGNANGQGLSAQFNTPFGMTIDSAGNLYICDTMNELIRKIDSVGNVTTIAGTGLQGFTDGPAANSRWYAPWGICMGPNGSLIIGANANERVRKIENGVVSTIAGSGIIGNQLGPALSAQFNKPYGVCMDPAGNVIFVDRYNHQIKKLTTAGSVVLVAGTGAPGFADGPAASATFRHPQDIAIDSEGNFYVSDMDNHAIRKISAMGVASTIAGNGIPGSQDGVGAQARFNIPLGLYIDPCDNLYITDYSNHKVRKIDKSGIVSTVAGSGVAGYLDGTALAANFYQPHGIVKDKYGNLFIGERGNHRIRKISRVNGRLTNLSACEGEEVVLSATLADSIKWISSENISCDNCFEISFKATRNATFIAHTHSACDFRADTFKVLVKECELINNGGDGVVYIPNVISPNGDGQNEYFVIKNIPSNTSVVIYNRWGVKLFESDNYQNNWDGKNSRGDDVSEGVYFYKIRFPGSKKETSGHLTVIR